MTDVIDMSSPVTRGELREALRELVTRGELREELVQLENRLERKFDDKLDLWGGALMARITESEKRLVSELARHTQAAFESMAKQISVVDEKYNDLPGRTDRLELEVHSLKKH
jgi:uncharacterized protein YhaN